MPTAPLDTELVSQLEGAGSAYAQADHFTALAGMFGEGAVLLPPPVPITPFPSKN